MPDKFKGVIKLDVRDSKPDWTPYTLKRAPDGAPNVLIVLYGDTGLAAWSPFGGAIEMPTSGRSISPPTATRTATGSTGASRTGCASRPTRR